jgi:biotin carboxylase
MPTHTYRAKAFLQAARRLGVEVVVGTDEAHVLASSVQDTALALDFSDADRAGRQVAEFAGKRPIDAVLGTDDDATLVAATIAEYVGLPHNSMEAVRAARDKFLMRELLSAARLASPWYALLPMDADPASEAQAVPYPCVLKPVALSASRGVIRADDPGQFVAAFGRIAAMLQADSHGHQHILVESFIPGPEVALEGLLVQGELRVLALFDKPDPLDGPYFEETLYVTPSRLPTEQQASIAATAASAAQALGLSHGPIHAELRLGGGDPVAVEIAARSIGGLCSNALRFGTGLSLEEVILRHATGQNVSGLEREHQAAGAMMLPIPKGGILRGVQGREEALAVPGIEEVAVTIPIGQPVVPLPEGDRYLGFLVARGSRPEEVEAALREAHRRLRFVIGARDDEDEECLAAGPPALVLPVRSGP